MNFEEANKEQKKELGIKMQIRIRTLQKDTFSVTVPTGGTVKTYFPRNLSTHYKLNYLYAEFKVAQLKDAVKQEKGHEVSWQKIIYSGKILQDEKTLESYSINENDFCVLMLKKVFPSHSEI